VPGPGPTPAVGSSWLLVMLATFVLPRHSQCRCRAARGRSHSRAAIALTLLRRTTAPGIVVLPLLKPADSSVLRLYPHETATEPSVSAFAVVGSRGARAAS
jgi:hypothetical protein